MLQKEAANAAKLHVLLYFSGLEFVFHTVIFISVYH